MKFFRLLLCLLMLLITLNAQAEPITRTVKKIRFDHDWQWIAGLNTASLLMHNSQAGLMKLDSDIKPFKEETIPGEFLAVPTIALPFAITYWGDSKDSFNHFKGYFMAFSINAIGTEFAKFIVERKRPGYDDALLRNEKTDKKSFFSGHSSQSFVTATYASLYIYNHSESFFIKYGVPFVLESAAGYVAFTRVRDNWHHEDDVIIGSLVGVSISGIVYSSYEHRAENTTGQKMEFGFGGDQLFVRYRF